MKLGIIPMQLLEKNGKRPFARILLTWTCNRYGVRLANLLFPLIDAVLKISGFSRSSITVCTRCVSSYANLSENYSPVVDNVTFCILLLMILHFGYSTFLYGDLKEEINMKCPQGISHVKKYGRVILNKCIYDLVQAACQYYKKAVEILKSSGFLGGSIDPCLYVKKSAKGIVYVALYVDNNLMICDSAMIDYVI